MIASDTHTPDHRHYSRIHPVTCKVSSSDLLKIESKAQEAGKSVSSFMRESALNSKVSPTVEISSINKEQWENLSRIASNLNQLTFHCHINSKHPLSTEMISCIAEIRNILHEVRQSLIGESIQGGCSDGG